MLNIYEFINSKAIREYCKKLGHTFNSMESAYLIYQSRNHTLPEKHTAWRELMETLPDMVIEERLNCPRYDSLHSFLQQYMALEDRVLETFFQDEKYCVYRFDTLYRPKWHGNSERFCRYEEGECVYQSFSSGLAAEKENIAEYLEDFLNFSVTKMKIRSDSRKEPWEIKIKVDENGVPLEIVGDKNAILDEEFDLFDSFKGMWIDVPTPFQKGDIVFTNHQKLGFVPDPFVLTYLCTDKETEQDKKKFTELLKKGDSSDMTAYGYRLLGANGQLWHECDHDYLSLEYYGDLTGVQRVLKVIQAYYQKEIDIDECMEAYHYILLDEQRKELKSSSVYLLDFLGFLDNEKV